MKRSCFVVAVILIFALCAVAFAACDLTKKDPIDLSGSSIRFDFMGKTEFEYNGLPRTPEFRIVDGNDMLEEYYEGVPNDNIVVKYENNTDVGIATVTVTPGSSGKYTGSLVGHFRIVTSSGKVETGDFASLKDYLEGGRYASVTATADITVPAGEKVTVADGVTLDMGGHALINNGTFENNGEINFKESGEGNAFVNGGTFKNNGKILFYASAENVEAFVNDGNLENSGEIYLNGNKDVALAAENNGGIKNDGTVYLNTSADFYNYGTFDNVGYVRASGEAKFYTNSDVSGNQFTALIRRYPIEEFKIYLSDEVCEYSGSEIRPAIYFEKEGYSVDYGDYDATFENNVNVGTATVKIVATKDSEAFFGETSLTFEITKGKTVVTDREGFYVAITNPNYKEIEVLSPYAYGTFFDKGFTVPEGVTLEISSASDEELNETVVNNGRIVVGNDKGLLIYGTVENNGEISAASIDNLGTLRNNGEISLEFIENGGTVENNGPILLGTGTSYSGNLANAGEITLAEGGILYAGGKGDVVVEFVNDGRVESSGTVYVNHHLVNNADFENNGDMFVFSTGRVSADKAITNSGSVYLNAASDAFTGRGNVNVKRQVQDADLVLEDTDDVYDGRFKIPAVTVAEETADGYVKEYFKDGSKVDFPEDAGTYIVTVTFKETSKTFYGNASVEYTIKRGAAEASTITEAVSLFDDPNYDTVNYVASFDNILAEDFEVPAGYTLTTSADSRLIVSGVSFNVAGTLTANGTIFFNTDTANVSVADGGTFVNNGKCYFKATAFDGIENGDGGEVIVRENMADATILTLDKTEVLYNMENGYVTTERPGFTLTDDGVEVEDSQYEQIYSNYYGISTEGDLAWLLTRAQSTSTKYYGEIRTEYTVLPGETDVATFKELKDALDNVKEGTELCNFGKVTVTADIDVEGNRTEQTLVVREGVTLVLGDHKLDLSPDWTFDEDVFLENNGVIEMTSYNIDCSRSSGNGKYVGYAGDADSLGSMFAKCGEIYLTADIVGEVTLTSSVTTDKVYFIDTCGYGIEKMAVSLTGKMNYTITSSVDGSVIGNRLSGDKAVFCNRMASGATLTLVNQTVYGIDYGQTDPASVIIDPTTTVY